MAHPPIHLFPPQPLRFDGEPVHAPRERGEIEALLDEVAKAGDAWVTFDGPEPTAHPDLSALLAYATSVGLRSRVVSNGRRLTDPAQLERLRDAGMAQLTLVLWGGSATTHDARTESPGAFEAAMDTIDRAGRMARLLLTVRVVLMADNTHEIGPLVTKVRAHAARVELARLGAVTDDARLLRDLGVPRKDAVRAVQEAWEAARITHLRLVPLGLGTWPPIPTPVTHPPEPADATLLELLRAHVPVPSAAGGTWATPKNGDLDGIWRAVDTAGSLHHLGLELAASGCPPLDLPPQLGGRGLDHPPHTPVPEDAPPLMRRDGVPALLARSFDADTRPLPAWTGVGSAARAAVVVGFLTDNITALSTLPALAGALRARGLPTTLHSVWSAPFNPHDPQHTLPHEIAWRHAEGRVWVPPEVVESLANHPARIEFARARSHAYVRALDLSDRDLVVVAGFDNGLDVLCNPTLRPDARVIVADFHLLTGFGSWQRDLPAGDKVADGIRWPGEHVQIHAIYPRTVRAYARARVPLRQLAWMPYPIHTGHFPSGPDVGGCAEVFAGGSHQRDWGVLAEAVHSLGPAFRDRLAIHAPGDIPSPLRSRGEVRLLRFHETLANTRFVVLPLRPDERRPAGISVISMAIAAGRPVIATTTTATVDHLRHGHNAILVPPSNPGALAKAIARLDGDPDLLARLSAGAQKSAASVSVDAWADRIVDGFPAQTSFAADGGDIGPFWSWPA